MKKVIGVSRTRTDAQGAIQRVKDKPGFREAPDGFAVDEYELNLDHWTEGCTSVRPETRR